MDPKDKTKLVGAAACACTYVCACAHRCVCVRACMCDEWGRWGASEVAAPRRCLHGTQSGEKVVTGFLTLVSLCSSWHSSSEITPSITTLWEPFKTLEFMVRLMPSYSKGPPEDQGQDGPGPRVALPKASSQRTGIPEAFLLKCFKRNGSPHPRPHSAVKQLLAPGPHE